MATRIYGLFDEYDNIRYIGKTTKELETRLIQHINTSKRGVKYRDNWIRSMTILGFKPSIKELCVTEYNSNLHESFFIFLFRSLGAKLTNGTDGGDGGATSETAIKGASTKRRLGIDLIAGKKAAETRKKLGIDKASRAKAVDTMRRKGIPFKTKENALKASQTRKKNGKPWLSKSAINKAIKTKKENGSYRIISQKRFKTMTENNGFSLSAKKAWETKRAKGYRGGGNSDSAKRGWETRRNKRV